MLHVATVPMSLGFLRGQGRYMRQHGIQLMAVTSPGPELERWGEAEGVPVFAVPMEREIAPVADARSLVGLVRVMRHVRPDIVHTHTPKASLLGLIAAKAAGIPHRLYHMRGLRFTGASGAKRTVLLTAERVTVSLASETIAVSPSLRQEAAANGLGDERSIRVLANGSGQGVDATRFDPRRFSTDARNALRAELGIDPGQLVFAFVGRATRDKGISELAEAWSRVREALPTSVLMLVGPFERGDAVPQETRERLLADPRVLRIGAVADTAPYYAVADVVCLPTYREGFPNVPLEAAAMETPTIASAVTGCVDAIEDGETGTLIPVKSSRALAAAMIRYADPSLRASHGTNGRRRVEALFRPELIWSELADTYHRAVSDG